MFWYFLGVVLQCSVMYLGHILSIAGLSQLYCQSVIRASMLPLSHAGPLPIQSELFPSENGSPRPSPPPRCLCCCTDSWGLCWLWGTSTPQLPGEPEATQLIWSVFKFSFHSKIKIFPMFQVWRLHNNLWVVPDCSSTFPGWSRRHGSQCGLIVMMVVLIWQWWWSYGDQGGLRDISVIHFG